MATKFAQTVVHRHHCACKSASRPSTDGEEPEHRFDVDGKPFPWHMSEEGPHFTRLTDDLYRVDVTIYGILRGSNTYPEQIICDRQYGPLTIAEREFPWTISDAGITYHRSFKTLSQVKLGFLAISVDTDGEVTDLRDIDRTITDNVLTPNEARAMVL